MPYSTMDLRACLDSWWTTLLRGAAATVFGVLLFTAPAISLSSLVTAFGTYTLLDGVLILAGAARRCSIRGLFSNLALAMAGLSLVTGVLVFAWPGMSRLALAYLLVGRLLTIGLIESALALPLRRAVRADGLLALGGISSVIFGSLFAAFPGPHLLTWISWMGGWASLLGFVLISLGVRLHAASLGMAWVEAHGFVGAPGEGPVTPSRFGGFRV